MRKLNKIFVHCSATPHSRYHDAADLRRWHLARGWSDIGYHYVILRDGTIETGRPLHKTGAHAAGHNTGSVGVCLIGGLGKNNQPSVGFTQAQFRALRRLVGQLREEFPTITTLYGHYQVADKACPCFDVPVWYTSNKIIPSNY